MRISISSAGIAIGELARPIDLDSLPRAQVRTGIPTMNVGIGAMMAGWFTPIIHFGLTEDGLSERRRQWARYLAKFPDEKWPAAVDWKAPEVHA